MFSPRPLCDCPQDRTYRTWDRTSSFVPIDGFWSQCLKRCSLGLLPHDSDFWRLEISVALFGVHDLCCPRPPLWARARGMVEPAVAIFSLSSQQSLFGVSGGSICFSRVTGNPSCFFRLVSSWAEFSHQMRSMFLPIPPSHCTLHTPHCTQRSVGASFLPLNEACLSQLFWSATL